MKPFKKPKYKFDVKKINIEGQEINKDKDISAAELFDEIVKSKARKIHR
jgi:hypothetical protein